MVKSELKPIKILAQKEIEKAKNLKELNRVFKKYLGKKGKLSLILGSLKKLSLEERKKIGKKANELKSLLEGKFDKKVQEIKKQAKKGIRKKEWVDVTIPGKKITLGHLHPLTLIKREVCEIFQQMGFEVVEGPEIETEWYNFDALNMPKDHPARDVLSLGKTFYLKGLGSKVYGLRSKAKLLMRTHTSPVQIRYMEKHQPPLRIIVPGRCFRDEATNASHEFQLHQLEGLMVGKSVSVANFKAVIQEFFKRFFRKPIRVQLRPDHFPFTEPSFEIAITCVLCEGKGCSACKNTGWMEVAGAGMVHPNVFENAGLVHKDWQGWAFGFGLDRLAMMRYKINDIRLFQSGDLRFLKQF